MERNRILEEFWSLRKSLNRGNKLANEETDFRFEIEKLDKSEFRLLFVIEGRAEEQKMEISRRNCRGYWERSGFTNFKNFEVFCSEHFNKWEKQNRTAVKENSELQELEARKMNNDIQKDFDNLLVNYAF